MGYTTDFYGEFEVHPKPLSSFMVDYLIKFSETRRMKRNLPEEYGIEGEYFVGGKGFMGQDVDETVVDNNNPPRTQPGLWCQWVPMPDGSRIVWDEGEKFYDYVEWLKYIAENFLLPFGYWLEGVVNYQGEDPSDSGKIIIEKNRIIDQDVRTGLTDSVFLKPKEFDKKMFPDASGQKLLDF